MKMKAISTASGSGMVTMSTERKWRRKTDVDQRDHHRLLDQRPLQGVRRPLDQGGAVVEGDDLAPPAGSPAWSAVIFSFTRSMTSMVLTP